MSKNSSKLANPTNSSRGQTGSGRARGNPANGTIGQAKGATHASPRFGSKGQPGATSSRGKAVVPPVAD